MNHCFVYYKNGYMCSLLFQAVHDARSHAASQSTCQRYISILYIIYNVHNMNYRQTTDTDTDRKGDRGREREKACKRKGKCEM